MKLTDLALRKMAPPNTGQQTHFDDALPGFGVRISQGGTKSFVVLRGRKRTRKTIGRYPEMSLADARKEAKRLQGSADEALAPARPDDISFRQARKQFLSDCSGKNRPRTVYDYRRILKRHFTFDKSLSAVTRRDLMRVISSLAHTPGEQKYGYVVIRTMLNWCVKQGYLAASPLPHLTFRASERDRILSDTEMSAVYRAAQDYPWPFGPIVQLLMLTGQRRGEIAALEWAWIDRKARTITLPASITKNRREHKLPYGYLTAQLFETLPELGRYLFPARTKSGTVFNGFSRAKLNFDKGIEGVEPYTLHDLRRTFSSTHAKLGTPLHVTEKLLNHVSGSINGIAAVYNRHTYADEMRSAMEAYEAHLAKLVGE